VDPRAGLDDVEKRKFLIPPGLELRLLGRPARSQSLYRLRYSGSLNKDSIVNNKIQACISTAVGRIELLWVVVSPRF
jgi:hypothetical protein